LPESGTGARYLGLHNIQWTFCTLWCKSCYKTRKTFPPECSRGGIAIPVNGVANKPDLCDCVHVYNRAEGFITVYIITGAPCVMVTDNIAEFII